MITSTEEAHKEKRKVDLVVLSDIHLGTYGCHAKELVKYMKSIKPGKVILNGDILDMWQFSKRYFPKSHMQVIHQIIKWVNKGTEVIYITGNHDELLRKFAGYRMGSLQIENKLLLNLDGKKAWIFHGDVFDVTMQHSKWLTRLGSHGYDLLILINACCNWLLEKAGRGKISLSTKVKGSVKSAVKYLNDFEKTCAEIAVTNGYAYVICGHIHHPEIKEIVTDKGKVMYLNSGDWVESLTALEYHMGDWKLYQYNEKDFKPDEKESDENFVFMNNQEVFKMMLKDFALPSAVKEIKK
jgi:UDP-2,3-diacylglucosamine pyrophosphatase LpxH